MKKLMEFINKQILDKEFLKNEIEFITSESFKQNLIILSKFYEIDPTQLFSEEINIYPPCEEYLLVVIKNEEDNSFSLAITSEKISNTPVEKLLVIGRCIYNTDCLKNLNNSNVEEVDIKILNCDYSSFLV